ncbi:hypothetical protein E1218_01120 [Kribbella turkmenica]|uniref:Lipoprotein n=1 Tax=Kribbella turkmenica TaxID=2530375 RepID=A0A4R4XHW5_9ACTN|nr:hypothetical protein [Kribbella turkmenica]TDD30436.1 hypothetical protein E1218_01120 [Kribbella turkmenica]
MRIRNLVVTATLIPVLMLAGCGDDDASSDVAASTPGAKKASKDGLTEQVDSAGQADPVVDAYYDYRVALDVMMRSGGRKTKHLAVVMTPNLFTSISAQATYFRTKKLRNTGTTKVLWAKRTLASSGVIVSACYDTTAARTVNSRGRSVLPDTTPTRWLDEMRVQQLQGRWVVDGGRTTPNAC